MRILFIIVLICISLPDKAQIAFSGRLNGKFCTSKNEVIRITSGIAPEVSIQWISKTLLLGIHYQYVFWDTQEEYVSVMRSQIIEFSFGFRIPIKEQLSFEPRFVLGRMWNIVRFDQEKQPNALKYNADFTWTNIEVGVMFDLEHQSGIIGSVGFRSFVGTATMPDTNPRYLNVAIGYRLKMKSTTQEFENK